jgi:hypothetical protein
MASTTFTSGTVVTSEWLNDVNDVIYDEVINVKSAPYNAVGDGVTDDTAAFTAAVARLNTVGGVLCMEGVFLLDAGTINITRNGCWLKGKGKGNSVNVVPTTYAPTTLIFKGSGAGIRIQSQSVSVTDLQITSDTERAAASFDINSPGIRVEPPDTSAADRADRSILHNLRIDNQPGDAVLKVGQALYGSWERIDIVQCKGFGFRLDPGSLAGLTRTYKNYVGLTNIVSCRVSYCGGHAIAASNPTVILQAQMVIRLRVIDMDSYGNGQNTAIMYAAADGIYYEYWIFGENCIIESSAPCGRVGLALTPEILGGVCIGGRDHKITNCRFIDTAQPIYWRHVSIQPNTGLEVDMFRLVQTALTHTAMVKYQSIDSKGLRVTYDRQDFFEYVATPYIGTEATSQVITYQGKHRHLDSIFSTGTNVTLADDSVYEIEFDGTSTIQTAGVLTLAGSAASSGGGIFHIRIAGVSPVATKWAGETNTIAHAGGGALVGTTGTDGFVSVSCDATKLYIENRLGYEIVFCIQLAAMPYETGIVI